MSFTGAGAHAMFGPASAGLTGPQAALGAAGIQTAGSLIGGMLGGSENNVGKHEYKEAAYGTIKGKIRAARDFGLHPLFALGTATPGPMQAIPGQSNWGSVAKEASLHAANALRDLAPQRTQAETDLLKAQTRAAHAQADAILREANTNPAPHGAGVTTSPAYIPPREFTRYDTMQGGSKRTSEASRQDAGETLGAIFDEWWHNPSQRPRIEREVAATINSMPYIRDLRDIPDPISFGRQKAEAFKKWLRHYGGSFHYESPYGGKR